mgnify:CR=1 FL=1
MGKVTGEMQMNITVYLGANEGSDPALKQACLLYTSPSPRDRG